MNPEVSARDAEANRVDTGNEAAIAQADAALTDDPAVYPPPDVDRRLVVLQDLGGVEDRCRDAWKRIRG